jgi:hypothetical protein
VTSSTSFRERWLADASQAFPRARAAGVADDLEAYLEEFHRLRGFRPDDLAQVPLDGATITFLLTNGLPESAPPYLSLEPPGRLFRPLAEAWDVLGRGGSVPPLLSLYVDGAGNAVGIDRRDSAVVWLDHEAPFTAPVYVNGDLVLFAEFLLAAQRRGLQLPIDPSLEQLDPRAFDADSFWVREYGARGLLSHSA